MSEQPAAAEVEARATADHAAYEALLSEDEPPKDWLRRLNRHAARQEPPLVVAGEGAGTLLAAWARRYRDKHPEVALFTHYVGCTGESRLADRLVERLLLRLRAVAGLPDPLPADPDARRELLPNWLARAAARARIMLVLADVDRLADGDAEQALDWLPTHLPPGVRVVLGVGANAPAATQMRQRGWQAETLSDAAASHQGLPDAVAPEVLRLLWACRRGLTAEELQAAGYQAPTPGPGIYRVADRLQLAGSKVRDTVRKALLVDGADRQAAHEAVAGLAAAHLTPERRRDELPWQLAAARDWEQLARVLATPEILQALLRQRDRLDLWHYWRAWGADAELVAWYAECLDPWRQQLDAETLADLVCGLCAAFREAGLDGDLGPFMSELNELASSLSPTLYARVLATRGAWLAEQGEAAVALEPLQQALALRRESLGEDHPETRTSRHQLATWYEEQGDLDAAVDLYRAGLKAREASLGERDPGLIPYLHNLGAVLKARNDFAAAKPCFRRALEIAERHYGNAHPTTAACLDNLAGTVYAEHDFEQAETLYQRALGIAEAVFGTMHAATAAAAHNLGAVMDAREDFRTAEMLFQRALDVREELFGAEHVDTASSLHNLAGVKDAMGRYDDAEPLYRRAVANWEAVVGKEHTATATSVNNLADLLRETGQFGEAEQLYRRNLATWRALVGEDHPHTLMTLCELAGLHAEQGRLDEAEPMLRDAVERTARVLGRDNMDHINAVTRLAGLLRETGRKDEARKLLKQTITAAEGTLGMISPKLQKLRRHLEALDVDPDRLH